MPTSNTFRVFDGSQSHWPLKGGGTGKPQPGDIIELAPGEHGPMQFKNLFGTTNARITIRGPQTGSQQAIIRRPKVETGNFVLVIASSDYLTIDGRLPTAGGPLSAPYECGIKVMYAKNAVRGTGGASSLPLTKDGPSAFIKHNGLVRWCTSQYIEIDGGWEYDPSTSDGKGFAFEGIGYSGHDNALVAQAGRWYDGNKYLHLYVHNTQGEGLYIGSNYKTGATPQRNIEIAYNRCVDLGGGATHLKTAFEGDNRVHHNISIRVGYNAPTPSRIAHTGQATTAQYYNNWIEAVAQGSTRLNDSSGGRPDGIQCFTTGGPYPDSPAHGVYGVYASFPVYIYNNVILNCGNEVLAAVNGNQSHGIALGRGTDSSGRAYASYVPYIFNNTVVGCSGKGIVVNSPATGGFVKNNIVLGNDQGQIDAGSVGGYLASDNKTSGTIADTFVSPTTNSRTESFLLKTSVPAVGAVSSRGPVAATDFLGQPRVAGSADMGAYEK
jgi:hypothetical protein